MVTRTHVLRTSGCVRASHPGVLNLTLGMGASQYHSLRPCNLRAWRTADGGLTATPGQKADQYIAERPLLLLY